MRPVGARHVAAYGYFGMGNIGNEGSLAALLGYLRKSRPDADLRCFAAGAEEVRREHGIPATQLMTLRARPEHAGPLAKVAKAAGRLWDIPRTFAMMGDVDVLVVPGTGVLETKLMPAPWGLPYWLFLATVSCRLRGRKVALVSVGAEHATHPLTRWLYRWTVQLSHYCSYRDEESRDAMRAMGVRGRRGDVYPDLAFALPTPDDQVPRAGHVVIGVMAYDGSHDDPQRGAEVRGAYAEHMAELVGRLLDEGRTVTMVVGDVHDREPAEKIEALVRSGRPRLSPARLRVSEAQTMDGIMAEMAAAEVVVASRFHNLICALKLRKPTVSLGYAEKNEHLLEELGLGGFCQSIDAFDVDQVMAEMTAVQRVQQSVEPHMKDILQQFQERLDEQFHRLDAELFGPVAPRAAAERAT